MKMRTSKAWTVAMIAALLLVMTMFFAACGSNEPATFEDYANEHEEIQTQLDQISQNNQGMTVAIEGNVVIYTYKYDQTFEEDVLDQMKEQFDTAMEGSADGFSNIATTLEEESGIDGISVRVIYLNGDGTEIYNKDFE